jgi:acyl-coenzyme A thioesterase PaaI-like protein
VRVKKDLNCYICEPDNLSGLEISFWRDGVQGSITSYVARSEHGGWGGILHGSVTFALMDEALGWALYDQDVSAVTARVETKFHRLVLVGARATIHSNQRSNEMRIRSFRRGDVAAFLRTLNEQWI